MAHMHMHGTYAWHICMAHITYTCMAHMHMHGTYAWHVPLPASAAWGYRVEVRAPTTPRAGVGVRGGAGGRAQRPVRSPEAAAATVRLEPLARGRLDPRHQLPAARVGLEDLEGAAVQPWYLR